MRIPSALPLAICAPCPVAILMVAKCFWMLVQERGLIAVYLVHVCKHNAAHEDDTVALRRLLTMQSCRRPFLCVRQSAHSLLPQSHLVTGFSSPLHFHDHLGQYSFRAIRSLLICLSMEYAFCSPTGTSSASRRDRTLCTVVRDCHKGVHTCRLAAAVIAQPCILAAGKSAVCSPDILQGAAPEDPSISGL